MGRYAWVNCNCVETGRLRIPHPVPARLSIHSTGEPIIITSPHRAAWKLHAAWLAGAPCAHVQCVLLAHDLGTTAELARIVQLIAKLVPEPLRQFPVLWTDVLSDQFYGEGDVVGTPGPRSPGARGPAGERPGRPPADGRGAACRADLRGSAAGAD